VVGAIDKPAESSEVARSELTGKKHLQLRKPQLPVKFKFIKSSPVVLKVFSYSSLTNPNTVNSSPMKITNKIIAKISHYPLLRYNRRS